MSGTIIPLAYDQDLVRTLEGMLEAAKNGKILGLAAVTLSTDKDGHISLGTGWFGKATTDRPFALLGGIDYLKHRIRIELVE